MRSFFLICSQIFFTLSVFCQPLHLKVNPFIGTGGHGHTYPGVSVPFGMMQLSPDTRLDTWDGCSGYHHSDSLIYGFSHTHLSGTGCSDYGDLLLMPYIGNVEWKNKDYASSFSHKNEKAHAGFYSVVLNKHNIKVDLTATARCGMHQYSFPQSTNQGSVLIDLQHRDQVTDASIEKVSDYEVQGKRISRAWAREQHLYFYIKFEKPIQSYGIAFDDISLPGRIISAGKNIKAFFNFNISNDKTIKAKVGISGVSIENAKLNLDTEMSDWSFENIQAKAEKSWDDELGKIQLKGGSSDQQSVFYTALYHASLAPNLYSDVNGDYRGTDLKVHKAEGFDYYTVFSLWDTYRALHPLMAITNKKRTSDWIKTFLKQYQQGGMLPVWELSANETFCMIGYHSVPVIAEAYQRGIRDFDTKLALEAMMSYAESNRFGLGHYQKNGFLGNDGDHESASKTMEYAYDDWCIAQFAKAIGNQDVYEKYVKRSLGYRNLFDPSTKHIRGKVHGFWYAPFDATEVNNFFTEGNSWHYSFSGQQDMYGLIGLYGGNDNFEQKLDEIFNTNAKMTGREQVDVTGLIGQYAHGNEPSHHIAYLYDYIGKPWKTQDLVHKICSEFYTNQEDGLIGNEDCGQMSAWYVLSAMGFYPVTPGSPYYVFGSPAFEELRIKTESGKTLTIQAKNVSNSNFYIKNITLNGVPYSKNYITSDLFDTDMTLVFEMTNQPVRNVLSRENLPPSTIEKENFVAVPFFDMNTNKFAERLNVKMGHIDPNADIYFTVLSENTSSPVFQKYTKPFAVARTCTVRFYAQKNNLKSPEIEQTFFKLTDDKKIKVKSDVHPMYTAGGEEALIDGILGTSNWRTGEWQSYYNKDFEAIIELKEKKPLQYVGVHVLQDVNPWIIYPQSVSFEVSDDGKNFTPLAKVDNQHLDKGNNGSMIQELGTKVSVSTKFIRVKAKSGGKLPDWHESAGSPSHLFIDEVIIK